MDRQADGPGQEPRASAVAGGDAVGALDAAGRLTMIEQPGVGRLAGSSTDAVTRVWTRLLLWVEGVSGLVGCGVWQPDLPTVLRRPRVAPGDKMIDWVIPRPRGCGRSVSLGRPRRR